MLSIQYFEPIVGMRLMSIFCTTVVEEWYNDCTLYQLLYGRRPIACEHEVKSNLAQIFDFFPHWWFSCCLNLLGAWDCG